MNFSSHKSNPSESHQIDLLIFDLDGTLVDTRQDLANSVNHVRKVFALPPLELAEVMSYIGDGVRNLLARSLPRSDDQILDRSLTLFRNHYREHLLDYSAFYPGVLDVLSFFKHKKMAVVSNKPVEFTRSILEGLEVAHYFLAVFGGDSLTAMKPDPEPLLQILDRLGVAAGRSVMVGDSPTDVEAGRRAGTRTCAVTYGFRSEQVLRQARPDYLLADLRNLKDIFD